MSTPAQVAATTKYVKTHMRQFVVRCSKDRDRDVIEYLESCGNVTAELKRLVRREIERKKSER